MKHKGYLYFFIFFFCSIASEAQVITGGTLGADYRNNGLFIELAPKIGYIYGKFESGVAPFLLYREHSNYLTYGSRVYTQVTVFEKLLIHGEFQSANVYVSSENSRQWVFGLPVGAGYKEKLYDKVWVYALILWDLLYKDGYSPQKNPIFRVGMTYSL